MEIITSTKKMQTFALKLHRNGKTIGFVPTMGYLHEGHLSLLRIARERCDILVASIFINPTQFSAGEDLDAYPRDFERDEELCENEGTDIIFYPAVDEMYPEGYATYVSVEGEMTNILCGYFRPGHFKGVTTVVAKLFDIIQPNFAVFGQKDGQQLAVIRRMVRDMNMPIDILAGPTMRESDGLAMSSRNKYLTPDERKVAPALYESLVLAKQLIKSGERDVGKIKIAMETLIQNSGLFKIQYIEAVHSETMQPLERISGHVMIAIAVYLGNTRLIDNILVRT